MAKYGRPAKGTVSYAEAKLQLRAVRPAIKGAAQLIGEVLKQEAKKKTEEVTREIYLHQAKVGIHDTPASMASRLNRVMAAPGLKQASGLLGALTRAALKKTNKLQTIKQQVGQNVDSRKLLTGMVEEMHARLGTAGRPKKGMTVFDDLLAVRVHTFTSLLNCLIIS